MEKIFRGVVQYRKTRQGDVFKQLSKITNSGPSPFTVLFTCMDSRIHPNVAMSSDIGDAFTVRNPGNIVPKSSLVDNTLNPAPEPAGLELGCVLNSIRNVVVCGHSDCKAMIAVHSLKESKGWSKEEISGSPLKAWLQRHGMDSLNRLQRQLESPANPLIFMKDTKHEFEAHIKSSLQEEDQLSQINTLVQMENIYSYGFMKDRMDKGESIVSGLWLCLTSGDVHYFSKKDKAFINIEENNIQDLLSQ